MQEGSEVTERQRGASSLSFPTWNCLLTGSPVSGSRALTSPDSVFV